MSNSIGGYVEDCERSMGETLDDNIMADGDCGAALIRATSSLVGFPFLRVGLDEFLVYSGAVIMSMVSCACGYYFWR